MDDLRLYYLPTCYYSRRVLNFLDVNGIDIALYATTEKDNHEYLVSHGGRNQVPCLFIGGRAMYESDNIIAYLTERFLKEG